MAKRILPSLSEPHIKWIKAVSKSTGEVLGAACWTAPGAPLHNYLRRSAISPSVYDWQSKMSWTDAEVDEMWSGVSDSEWNVRTAENDELRRQTFGDEPHWYLAPLCCWPEHQGKGVGKRLLNWAIERADKSEPVQPLFLESAPSARVVYLHVGFVPVGERTAMMRRGPKKVEVEDGQKKV
jgi:GNAT superfamily N-acetyltransferase